MKRRLARTSAFVRMCASGRQRAEGSATRWIGRLRETIAEWAGGKEMKKDRLPRVVRVAVRVSGSREWCRIASPEQAQKHLAPCIVALQDGRVAIETGQTSLRLDVVLAPQVKVVSKG